MRAHISGLLLLLSVSGHPALAEDASSRYVVFADGSRVAVRHYEIQKGLVVFETEDGELRSMSLAYIDVAATERANTQPPTRANPAPSDVSLAAESFPASNSVESGIVIIDGPPPPVPPEMVARDGAGRVTFRAVRADGSIVVDGLLDDAIYQRVPPVTGFIQQEPHEGELATEKTEIWILFDDESLYVSARCWDSHPERMVISELRRGHVGIAQGDNLTVVLDTFYDRRNGFFFQTNPLGGVYDSIVTDERNENIDWDTVWDTQAARFEGGWAVEIAIPFASLRYKAGASQVWGVNIRRIVQWRNEMSFLNPVPASYGRAAIMKTSSSAALVGLEVPEKSVNFELKPYAITDVTTDTRASPPLSNDTDADWGFDAKYGLTRGLVADFTYNTDFAQVEVDEAQINLTRFNLFFPEKRQFFLEGRDIFRFGGAGPRFSGLSPVGEAPIVFFTRRIGLSEGQPIPIEVGGRVTGRAGDYTIGALAIRTEDDLNLGVDATNFAVARLKRNVFTRSSIGVIATHRSPILGDSVSNQVFGVDGAFAFLSNLFIDTYYAKTHTEGRDGNDESYRATVQNNGDRYGFEYEHLFVGDDFNPEIGFVRRDDFRRNFGKVQFTPRPASNTVIRKYRFEGSFDRFTGATTDVVETRESILTFGIEFQNSDRWNVNYTRSYEFLTEPFQITGDVAIPPGGYDFQAVSTSYRLGQQNRLSGTVGFQTGGFFSGDRTEASYTGRFRATNKFALEPAVAINWIDLPEGKFTTELARLRVIYAMSPRMFIEGLTQYNSSTDAFGTNIRFRWEYSPGSDLYVVYNEGRDASIDDRFPLLTNRLFAVKFTRLFRF